MPQLRLSVWVSRQTPEQSGRPAAQERVHAPLEQTLPAGHARAQAPQLPLSVARSRQVPEQLVKPAVQLTVQVPPEQT